MQKNTFQPLYTVTEAAQLMRVGKTRFYEILKSGGIPALKNGKTTLVKGQDIATWIESLPQVKACNSGGEV